MSSGPNQWNQSQFLINQSRGYNVAWQWYSEWATVAWFVGESSLVTLDAFAMCIAVGCYHENDCMVFKHWPRCLELFKTGQQFAFHSLGVVLNRFVKRQGFYSVAYLMGILIKYRPTASHPTSRLQEKLFSRQHAGCRLMCYLVSVPGLDWSGFPNVLGITSTIAYVNWTHAFRYNKGCNGSLHAIVNGHTLAACIAIPTSRWLVRALFRLIPISHLMLNAVQLWALNPM